MCDVENSIEYFVWNFDFNSDENSERLVDIEIPETSVVDMDLRSACVEEEKELNWDDLNFDNPKVVEMRENDEQIVQMVENDVQMEENEIIMQNRTQAEEEVVIPLEV